MERFEGVVDLGKRWAFFLTFFFLIGFLLNLFSFSDTQAANKPAKAAESSKAASESVTESKPAEKRIKVESSNPFSGDPKAIASGQELYFTWCVQCHGKNADGVSPRWGKYAKDLRRFWQGYSKFVLITVTGVKGKQMPPWGEHLSGDQISHIGAYLETLALEGANWK